MMKKSIFMATLAVVSLNSFANRVDLEADVLKLAKKVNRLANQNADTLSNKELRDVKKHLTLAVKIIKGIGTTPVPPTNPRPIYRVCSQDSADIFQQTFIKIKNFAYSSSGLDMTSSGATQFAQEFTETHSCETADIFMSKSSRLKTFAYSTSGLDMTSSNAKSYAMNKWQSFCEDFPIESEFKKHYTFAYSSSGLDMTSSNARRYAQEKVEPVAFSCGNIF